MQYDFAYDLCGNNLVIAHLYIDQFSVYQVSEKGFEKQYQVNGSKNGAADKCYYSDVSCTPDGIMLLSNAHVDLKSLAGQSEIEYYSWDLTPLKMIKLDMIGDRLLRNVQDSLLWLHSPLDDDIYWSEF